MFMPDDEEPLDPDVLRAEELAAAALMAVPAFRPSPAQGGTRDMLARLDRLDAAAGRIEELLARPAERPARVPAYAVFLAGAAAAWVLAAWRRSGRDHRDARSAGVPGVDAGRRVR